MFSLTSEYSDPFQAIKCALDDSLVDMHSISPLYDLLEHSSTNWLMCRENR